MKLATFKEKSKWWCLGSGIVFLLASSYMRIKFIFESGNTGGALLLIALVAVSVTLVLALVTLPRWQSFIGLATCAYGLYWFFNCPIYAVS